MIQWDKSIASLGVPASDVINLFRSMREVQLALSGLPAQQTSSFICQYRTEGGVGTVAAFHMHKSEVLAFFPMEPHVVPESKVDSMLDQGLSFVESMGFLMTDQDIHLLDSADQEMLWSSLPLKDGLAAEEEVKDVSVPEQKTKPEVKQEPAKPAPVEKKVVPKEEPKPEPQVLEKKSPSQDNSAPDSAENVDDLLAAVEAMRAKRPGVRARKMPPSPVEMERRRQQLRETVGRVLASL